jgi:hypothetical protein
VRSEANPQVDEHLMTSPQVVESTPRTLSRWRHGFEPRWDYKQRPRSDALSSLSGESVQPVVPRTNATRQGPAEDWIRVVSTDASLGDAAPQDPVAERLWGFGYPLASLPRCMPVVAQRRRKAIP